MKTSAGDPRCHPLDPPRPGIRNPWSPPTQVENGLTMVGCSSNLLHRQEIGKRRSVLPRFRLLPTKQEFFS